MNAAVGRSLVLIVDDDPAMRDALQALFRSVGLDSEAYGSTAEVLERAAPEVETCLVLDVRLPGVSGLDFQTQLAASEREWPVVFISGSARFLFTPMAMAVVFAMMTSYLLSRTLVPTMVQFFLRHETAMYGGLPEPDEAADAGTPNGVARRPEAPTHC